MKRKSFTFLLTIFCFAFLASGFAERTFKPEAGLSLVDVEETERYYLLHVPSGLAMTVSDDVARTQVPDVGNALQHFEIKVVDAAENIVNIISDVDERYYHRADNNWTTNFVDILDIADMTRAEWIFSEVTDGVYTIRAVVNIETHFLGPNNNNPNEVLYADKGSHNTWRLVNSADAADGEVAGNEIETALGDLSDVSGTLNLISETAAGTAISWSSSHPAVIDPATGEVTPDPNHNREVILTAAIGFSSYSYTAVVNTATPVDPLVMHYTFDDVLDETNSTITDATGNGYDGEAFDVEILDLNGMKALDLGADNGYVSMNTLGNLVENLNDFSVSVNAFIGIESDLGPNGNMIWSFGNSDNMATDRNGYVFYSTRNTGWTITETYWANDMGVGGGSQMTKGVWVNVIASLNGNVATVHVNGELVASNELTLKPSDLGNTAFNFLGRPLFAGDSYLSHTLLNDFRIYNKALNADERAPLLGNVDLLNAALEVSLSDLSVDAGQLEPAFDPAVTEYTLVVPFGTATVNVTATPDPANAIVGGDGAIEITDGTATATVTVAPDFAYSAAATAYTIEITEEEPLDYTHALKVHYTFEQALYDETELTVADATGSFTGTLMNEATVVEDHFGMSALSLGDGTGYFDLSAQVGEDVLSTLEDFTITAFVYVPEATDLGGHGRFLWGFSNSDAVAADQNGLAYFRLPNSQYTITPESWQDGNQRVVDAGVPPARNVWQRLTVVQSGYNIKIYMGDELIADNSTTVDMVMADLGATIHNYIGFPSYTQGDNYLRNVYVADFRIYNEAVEAEYIADISVPEEVLAAAIEVENALGDLSDVAEGTLNLITDATNGALVSWGSSHPDVINPETGVVTPDPDHNREVYLTATISFNTIAKVYRFVAVVNTENPIDPLAVHYTFEDVLTEENNTITDVTGNEYDGEANGVEIIDVAGHKVLDLGPDNGFVQMHTLGNLIENLNDFTISVNVFVANQTDLGPNGSMFWSFGNSDNAGTDRNGYMFFGARGTGWTITESFWEHDQGVNAGSNVVKGEWVNVVASLNGNMGYVYVNGELVASNEITIKPSDLGNTPFNFLGKPVFQGDRFMLNTLLNDFRIYTKALNDEERATIPMNIEALNAEMEYAVLSDLSTDVSALNPVFDPEVSAYSVILPIGTNLVNVSASTESAGATISGDGEIEIVDGSATATVVVESPYPYVGSTYAIQFSEASGNNYALSLPGGPDGLLSHVVIPALNIDALPVTVEVWFKPAAGEDGNKRATVWYHRGTEGNGDPNTGFQYDRWDNTSKIKGIWDDQNALPEGTPVAEEWNHMAMVVTETTHTVYINGEATLTEGTFRHLPFDDVTYLGFDFINWTDPQAVDRTFAGEIDEVRFWNVERSAEELMAYRGVALNGNEEGLIGYWNFDLPNSAVAVDLSGNGNHGIISGGTYVESFDATDATLASLELSEGVLEPEFNAEVMDYESTLPLDVTATTISATPNMWLATVDGLGEVEVSLDGVTVDVVVTALDGTTQLTYKVALELDPTTNIIGLDASSVEVYPTVSSGQFTVKFAGEPGMITVYNLAGTVVSKINATSVEESVSVPGAGVYLLQIESEGEVTVVKVVKTN